MSRGLSKQQRRILAHVHTHGSATIAELAALIGMRSDSVRRAAESLEARGFVEHGMFQKWREAPPEEIVREILHT
jgi:DNA-binding MarR family transcriptional regulator